MAKPEERSHYFPHDVRARADLKIRALLGKFGVSGYGAYWVIIEHLREADGFQLSAEDWVLQALGAEIPGIPVPVEELVEFMVQIGLLKREGGFLFSDSLLRRMERYTETQEKRRAAGKASAESRKKKDLQPAAESTESTRKTGVEAIEPAPADFVTEYVLNSYPRTTANEPLLRKLIFEALKSYPAEKICGGVDCFVRYYAPTVSPEYYPAVENFISRTMFLENWKQRGIDQTRRGGNGNNNNGIQRVEFNETEGSLLGQLGA